MASNMFFNTTHQIRFRLAYHSRSLAVRAIMLARVLGTTFFNLSSGAFNHSRSQVDESTERSPLKSKWMQDLVPRGGLQERNIV